MIVSVFLYSDSIVKSLHCLKTEILKLIFKGFLYFHYGFFSYNQCKLKAI
jgi:hypothetical protein